MRAREHDGVVIAICNANLVGDAADTMGGTELMHYAFIFWRPFRYVIKEFVCHRFLRSPLMGGVEEGYSSIALLSSNA